VTRIQAQIWQRSWLCLPELFRSRYFCQTEDYRHFALAEPLSGPSTEAFGALATALDVTVIVSVFERRAAGLYHNTAVVIEGKRGLLGAYRKMHIPSRHCQRLLRGGGQPHRLRADTGRGGESTRHRILGAELCGRSRLLL
jgi:predicted amidohydrolase